MKINMREKGCYRCKFLFFVRRWYRFKYFIKNIFFNRGDNIYGLNSVIVDFSKGDFL